MSSIFKLDSDSGVVFNTTDFNSYDPKSNLYSVKLTKKFSIKDKEHLITRTLKIYKYVGSN